MPDTAVFSPEIVITATADVQHPARELSPDEREHLGLGASDNEEKE